MSAMNVNDENFRKQVLEYDKPVLVDFWAPWCPPCRKMSPVVDQLAGEVGDRARVVKVNVDEAGQAAVDYGVQSIPTFAVVHQGQVKERFSGVVSKERLLQALQAHSN